MKNGPYGYYVQLGTRKDTFPSGLRFHRYFDKHFIELGCEFFHMYKYQFSAFILL